MYAIYVRKYSFKYIQDTTIEYSAPGKALFVK